MYSLCPGTPVYMFTSPLFSKIVLHLAGGKDFVITAASNSPHNVYVQRRQLNGADDPRTWINYSDLMQGGELHLDMGEYANMRIIRDEELPYSASPY